jgi:hypothetical protein
VRDLQEREIRELRLKGLPTATNAFTAATKPQLLMVIDTEEEFDWSKPLARENISVSHIADLPKLQAVFEGLGITPTYVIDYPIAASNAGAAFFSGLAQEGRVEIGMQLHPWVTPPYEEEVTAYNSYGCNLPADLERRKLDSLHAMIKQRIGVAPILFKAGRYGPAHDTLDYVQKLGVFIDMSATPAFSLESDGGPDFSKYSTMTGWIYTPTGKILEIPTTGGFVGILSEAGSLLSTVSRSRLGAHLRVPAMLARTKMLERMRLSPEGYSLDELKRLTRSLYARGERIFTMSLHSPSAGIGFTPYVRSEADRAKFFAVIDDYVRWFCDELGGAPSTPSKIFQAACA